MTDLFLRCAPATPLRAFLAMAVIERWKLEQGINLRVIWKSGTYPLEHIRINETDAPIETSLSGDNFQWASRDYAERNATTDPYLFCDDDHLVLGKDWVARALKLWGDNRTDNLAFIGSDSIMPSENQRQNYERINGHSAPEVYQAPYAMGAPLIHRRGVIDYSKFEGAANQQDDIVTTWLRSKGMRFCYARDLLYLHLGFGLSQVTPALWLRY